MSQKKMNTVLFLCTANYYRSRFAEFYFNALAPTRGLPWQAESRGLRLNVIDYGPIYDQTVSWLEQRGIALPSRHRYPLPVEEDDLHRAKLIVAVKEAEHRPLLTRNFPAWAETVEYWHVDDLDCAMPHEALPELAGKVEELVNRLTESLR
jgi:protein-tyrosine phosphatase